MEGKVELCSLVNRVLEARDACSALGLPAGASDEDRRKAYFKVLRLIHPDKQHNASNKAREACDKATAHLHQLWTHQQQQQQYTCGYGREHAAACVRGRSLWDEYAGDGPGFGSAASAAPTAATRAPTQPNTGAWASRPAKESSWARPAPAAAPAQGAMRTSGPRTSGVSTSGLKDSGVNASVAGVQTSGVEHAPRPVFSPPTQAGLTTGLRPAAAPPEAGVSPLQGATAQPGPLHRDTAQPGPLQPSTSQPASAAGVGVKGGLPPGLFYMSQGQEPGSVAAAARGSMFGRQPASRTAGPACRAAAVTCERGRRGAGKLRDRQSGPGGDDSASASEGSIGAPSSSNTGSNSGSSSNSSSSSSDSGDDSDASDFATRPPAAIRGRGAPRSGQPARPGSKQASIKGYWGRSAGAGAGAPARGPCHGAAGLGQALPVGAGLPLDAIARQPGSWGTDRRHHPEDMRAAWARRRPLEGQQACKRGCVWPAVQSGWRGGAGGPTLDERQGVLHERRSQEEEEEEERLHAQQNGPQQQQQQQQAQKAPEALCRAEQPAVRVKGCVVISDDSSDESRHESGQGAPRARVRRRWLAQEEEAEQQGLPGMYEDSQEQHLQQQQQRQQQQGWQGGQGCGNHLQCSSQRAGRLGTSGQQSNEFPGDRLWNLSGADNMGMTRAPTHPLTEGRQPHPRTQGQVSATVELHMAIPSSQPDEEESQDDLDRGCRRSEPQGRLQPRRGWRMGSAGEARSPWQDQLDAQGGPQRQRGWQLDSASDAGPPWQDQHDSQGEGWVAGAEALWQGQRDAQGEGWGAGAEAEADGGLEAGLKPDPSTTCRRAAGQERCLGPAQGKGRGCGAAPVGAEVRGAPGQAASPPVLHTLWDHDVEDATGTDRRLTSTVPVSVCASAAAGVPAPAWRQPLQPPKPAGKSGQGRAAWGSVPVAPSERSAAKRPLPGPGPLQQTSSSVCPAKRAQGVERMQQDTLGAGALGARGGEGGQEVDVRMIDTVQLALQEKANHTAQQVAKQGREHVQACRARHGNFGRARAKAKGANSKTSIPKTSASEGTSRSTVASASKGSSVLKLKGAKASKQATVDALFGRPGSIH